jgi:hypothetical protein
MTAEICSVKALNPWSMRPVTDWLLVMKQEWFDQKVQSTYIGRKIRISVFAHNFFTKDFYVNMKLFNSEITTEMYIDCHVSTFFCLIALIGVFQQALVK